MARVPALDASDEEPGGDLQETSGWRLEAAAVASLPVASATLARGVQKLVARAEQRGAKVDVTPITNIDLDLRTIDLTLEIRQQSDR